MAVPKRASRRVRPVSRTTANTRIRSLKCFNEVYQRITEGWPLNEVARFIQDVKKESVDITFDGLVTALKDFRATIPPAELIKGRLTPTYVEAAKEVEEGVDELKELEKLYRLQMQRIDIDVTNERNIKKLLPTTGQEVRIAREILSTYADLKMDLGLSKRHLGQMDIDARVMADVAVRYKPEIQTVLSDAESRKKVLNLAERLLSRSSNSLLKQQEIQDAEVVEEGAAVPREDVETELFEEDPLKDPIDLQALLEEAQ